jgi:glycerol uptake facilitator protein
MKQQGKRECIAEFIGTYILVFFGTGSVHSGVLTGSQSGLWQVAVVWGVAIALAIYTISALSGAHINPAVTISFFVFRKFPFKKVPQYIFAQVVGAFCAAATLHGLFCNVISSFESSSGIIRGETGSEVSAMVYGQYFPNPAVAGAMEWTHESVSTLQAMLAEGIGTAFLVFFIFSLTDPGNHSSPGKKVSPLCIGLTVSIIISIIAPLTQAGLNPARDFGPRLFSYLAGWGHIALPGPRNGFFTVYILAPVAGALGGALLFQFVIQPAFLSRKRSTV